MHHCYFFRCTSLVSNAVALKLLLKMAQVKKVFLPSMDTVILLGEKVASELLISIERVMKNARRIAVCVDSRLRHYRVLRLACY